MLSFLRKKIKKLENLKAFLDGKVIPITEVDDPVFSSKAMGDGVAIIPDSEVLKSPADGKVTVIMDNSFHAIGLKLTNGMEVLMHIGMDTVNMKGEGFTPFVKVGDKVSTGDKLIQFSRKSIQDSGYSDVTILAVTNSEDYPALEFVTGIEAKAGETIIAKV